VSAHDISTLVLDTNLDKPHLNPSQAQKVRDADVVLLRHPEGLWSVYKDRRGHVRTRVPWDGLPEHVKKLASL